MVKKNITVEVKVSIVYRFCGNGRGIPGLPHEVTAFQAESLGLLEVLREGIRKGTYKEIQQAKIAPASKGE